MGKTASGRPSGGIADAGSLGISRIEDVVHEAGPSVSTAVEKLMRGDCRSFTGRELSGSARARGPRLLRHNVPSLRRGGLGDRIA
jgi:hypothetical protein